MSNNITRLVPANSMEERDYLSEGFYIASHLMHSGTRFHILKKERNNTGGARRNAQMAYWHGTPARTPAPMTIETHFDDDLFELE